MADRTKIDPDEFRRALSCFTTGVTVVTTLDTRGENVGMTVSSFNSVSLDPPLILWSVGVDAQSYDVFTEVEHFAVHVLALDQKILSERFAQRGGKKFDSLECVEGLHGVPILPEFIACFECSTEHIYPGGDHRIIVGRVHRFEERKNDPLIIYRSQFLEKGSP